MNNKCHLCGYVVFKTLYNERYGIGSQQKAYSVSNVRRYGHGQIVKCLNCGIVYTYKPHLSVDISEYYEKMVDREYLLEWESRSKTYDNFFGKLKKMGINSGKLLDIGCAYGILLKKAAEINYNPTGIELSQDARDFIKKTLKIPQVVKDVSELNYGESYFDVITMIEVIEHLAEPKQMLDAAKKLLKNSGLLFLTTPNINSLAAKLLGERWWGIMDAHRFYFSPYTITGLLEKSGFKVINIHSYGRYFSFGHWLEFISGFLNIRLCGLAKIRKILYLNLGDHMQIWAKPSAD